MKTKTIYMTIDGKEFAIQKSAESHALEKATLDLKEVLQAAGVENPYAYASKIILSAFEGRKTGDLGEAYYKLFNCVACIKDAYRIEKE